MSPTPPQFTLRQVQEADRTRLSRFLATLSYFHRHLDWREPLEWLGRQPFWVLEKNGQIEAMLACLPEPDGVAWVRLFAVAQWTSPAWAWKLLFGRVLYELMSLTPQPEILSLSLQDWYTDLLCINGFQHYQDIITLSQESSIPPPLPDTPGILLRRMTYEDLPAVVRVDNLAFEPIWRLSLSELTGAFERTHYNTVIEIDSQVVAYQMSSLNGYKAHLARLAVHPASQRQGLGYRLVRDVLDYFLTGHNTWGVTLNTQSDNHASLALYQNMGFHVTGESFPVYRFA